MFFRLATLFAIVSCVFGFQPARISRKCDVTMSAQPSFLKTAGAVLIGASLFGTPVLAKEGAGAKLSFFGDSDFSSPYTLSEKREDAIYSPYSPFGDGTAAVYNGRRGGKEELAFWNGKLTESL